MFSTLSEFITMAVSPYQTVDCCIDFLKEKGFTELPLTGQWESLLPGGKYVINAYDTSAFAFVIGENVSPDGSLYAAAAHTDHPGFRIKPNAVMKENLYIKLNTEVYGGAILYSWLDRPLSIAGRICLKNENSFYPSTVLFDAGEPVVSIPSLAIHMNREVNKGIELNRQTQLSPLFSLKNSISAEKDSNINDLFVQWLAREIHVVPDNIINYDLSLYNADKPQVFGTDREFLLSPRLDNLTSVYALLQGITQAKPEKGIAFAAFYDNEEVGSQTKQGADSMLTTIILQKIYASLGLTEVDRINAIMSGIFLSLDVAHGLHPNYSAKSDPTNTTTLGNGFAIKLNSSQRYATDSKAIAFLLRLCESQNIPVQQFVNRSDGTPGGTLGSLTSSWLPALTIDLGVPILAMHSACETMVAKDQESLEQLIISFYRENR